MAEYIYFCTSLPYLRRDAEKPPLSSEEFLRTAETILSSSDFSKLSKLDFSKASRRVMESGFLREYYAWEVALRNQVLLQRLKVVEQRGDAAKPHSGATGSTMLGAAVEQILQQQQPFAIEYGLDQLRWEKLDELCGAQLFNMVFLACYFLKLKILERTALWQKETGKELYEKVSKEIVEDEKVGEV